MDQAHPRPWHRGSLFTEGPRRPLDRNARRLWLAMVDRARRAGCGVTPLHALVGAALARRLGVDGQLDPSHATLAADVGCGARTVRRAVRALADAGLLRWLRRLVRVPWPAGGRGATRAEQISNSYVLELPAAPRVQPRLSFGRLNCGGQVGRETQNQILPTPTAEDQEAAKRALREIAAARLMVLTGQKSR